MSNVGHAASMRGFPIAGDIARRPRRPTGVPDPPFSHSRRRQSLLVSIFLHLLVNWDKPCAMDRQPVTDWRPLRATLG